MTEGIVSAINGNIARVHPKGPVRMGEVAHVCFRGIRLKSEVVRMRRDEAELQIFESVNGLRVGLRVEFSGETLSVELGPGLLGSLYDGLQNPLNELARQFGFFLSRGAEAPGLDPERAWNFTPVAEVGDRLHAGDVVGEWPEGGLTCRALAPFDLVGAWKAISVARAGVYRKDHVVAQIQSDSGETRRIRMGFNWPVKRPVRAYSERLAPSEALTTRIRIVDSMFPVGLGGSYCIPGPFGAGKTVLQQLTSRHAHADVVVLAACGERAGEVVETIQEFPELLDPHTGRPLMERTVIICNTSSMPVAAREASVYTAVTIAEYFRQMGLRVLMLADSTSRWAQAMRERSGWLEEIPGEEAFPAYLESTIAAFYERAGRVRLRNGQEGSLTIGGTVSPAGGAFDEPVTQATLKVVGAFHALSRERADARRYPAIDPLDSWSRYDGFISKSRRQGMLQTLSRGNEIDQMMRVVGEEGVSIDDFIHFWKSELVDIVFLQQNAFDEVDVATPRERQLAHFEMLERVIAMRFEFETKEAARSFFQRLIHLWLDWNGAKWDSEVYEERGSEIENELLRHAVSELDSDALAKEARPAFVESKLDADATRRRRMNPDQSTPPSLVDEHEGDRD